MKKTVIDVVYSKYFKGNDADVRFSDLPKDIFENDIIEISRYESYLKLKAEFEG